MLFIKRKVVVNWHCCLQVCDDFILKINVAKLFSLFGDCSRNLCRWFMMTRFQLLYAIMMMVGTVMDKVVSEKSQLYISTFICIFGMRWYNCSCPWLSNCVYIGMWFLIKHY